MLEDNYDHISHLDDASISLVGCILPIYSRWSGIVCEWKPMLWCLWPMTKERIQQPLITTLHNQMLERACPTKNHVPHQFFLPSKEPLSAAICSKP